MRPPRKPTKAKVIRSADGIERVAQACDRCRLKKTKCDGKRPQCSQCAAVGFECKISDRLLRRAFPRGYTESLEERVRELEAENKKLQALIDLKNEQMDLVKKPDEPTLPAIKEPEDSPAQLNQSNLLLLNSLTHEPHAEGCNCGCVNYPHSVHERPTSIAASVVLGPVTDDDDDDLLSVSSLESGTPLTRPRYFDDTKKQLQSLRSNMYYPGLVLFEQKEAPGAAAAVAIALVKKDPNHVRNQIALLVAMLMPRTTEEILFIPSLIGKVGATHGFHLRAALLTARSLALLKNHFVSKNPNHVAPDVPITFGPQLNFFLLLRLPGRLDLDQLVTFYFQEWLHVLPVVHQQDFLKSYMTLVQSAERGFSDGVMAGKERFGAVVLLMVTLALVGKRRTEKRPDDDTRFVHVGEPELTVDDGVTRLLNYYDALIQQIVSLPLVEPCCVQSLQVLTLALMYNLNVGNIGQSYTLRGKVVSMCQQLRLHRCPSAVLSNTGLIVPASHQAERRILFWCVYVLDVFGLLQLGVPRLLKDYEIECALPFANDDLADDNNTNILIVGNLPLLLVGRVSSVALAVMRFSKILGNVLDAIFRRGGVTTDSLARSCIVLEDLLENWRKELPSNLRFDLDVSGMLRGADLDGFNRRQLLVIVLYYQAKILIYLPVLAAEVRNSRGLALHVTINQSTNAILAVTNYMSSQSYFLPTPMNLSRMRARYGLLGAKGALEYTRGGNLFQDVKTKLQDLMTDLRTETARESPGCLSANCVRMFEETIQAVLLSPKPVNTAVKPKKRTKNNSSSLKNSVTYPEARSEPMTASSSVSRKSDVPSMFDNPDPMALSHPMSVSSTQMKGLLPDFEFDSGVLSEFAADGSLGLAQLLEVDLGSIMQQLEKDIKPEPNGSMDISPTNYNMNHYNANSQHQAGGLAVGEMGSFFNNNDNNPVPADDLNTSRGLFDWQRRN